MPPRLLTPRVFFLGLTFTLFLLYESSNTSLSSSLSLISWRTRSTCTPRDYAAGQWRYRPRTNRTKMTSADDALPFTGFDGCASSREFFWHLGSDKEEHWDRFPGVGAWRWEPPQGCKVRDWNREEMVRDLVEQGGWLILGDSISEGHFFSLSCMLYPHVLATPDYVANPYFDRAWPQQLHLNPSSPLVSSLRFPPGFNISATPLATFRRIDLLLEPSELVALHQRLYNPRPDFTLFSEEATWNLSPGYYMDLFQGTGEFADAQLNYGTLVMSTAGHWTTTLFDGYRDESKADSGYGIDRLLAFFEHAMRHWARVVQGALAGDEGQRLGGGGRGRRNVVVRAYLPGHEDCHRHREPWTEVQPYQWNWYNWANIPQFNDVFERVLSAKEFPTISFLSIDRPGRLRPDGHVSSDCLHVMTGSGVMEGWTHYVWHYVSREIGGRIR